jgi:hypothetical protein
LTLRTIDATVGAEGSAACLGRSVHLDVANDKAVHVKPLYLSVRLSVLQEDLEELDRLGRKSNVITPPLLVLGHRVASASAWKGSVRERGVGLLL